VLPFQRELIEGGFGAPLRDRYGSAEFACSMTQCSHDRLHLDEEFGLAELEVRERGPDWERGSLLVTGLANDAMPFLRYRIGDVATRQLVPCACGQPGEVFVDIDGRVEDMVVTPDGREVGRLDHVFKDLREIAEAQIVQHDTSSIEVRFVPASRWRAGSEERLLTELRLRLGTEIQIVLRPVNEIPREVGGKLRAVKSSLRPGGCP
jgi:phenylacetate-CoA ligase